MTTCKKVSVLTVVHNCPQFLASAYKSFAYQDYPNMEWIIINDASTDKTAQILQKMHRKDPRIKLCLNKVPKGCNLSYAFGLEKAEGEYIAFLEPSDFWVKNKISRQLGFMVRYDAAMSHSSYAFADDTYEIFPTGSVHIEPKVSLLNYGKETDIVLSTLMLKKEEIEDFLPIPPDQDDFIMHFMLKGLLSQGMSDVLTLCRLKYDSPQLENFAQAVHKLNRELRLCHQIVPNLTRYRAYKASNVTAVKLDPSIFIDKNVYMSMNELKNFKL